MSPMGLGLALCLVGMHSAAASKWALTIFSYSSFGVCVSDFSCSTLNLFFSINIYLSPGTSHSVRWLFGTHSFIGSVVSLLWQFGDWRTHPWKRTSAQVETQLHSLERAVAGIGLDVNANKMEYMCFNQRGHISTLNSSSLKLVDKFTYLGSSVSSTEKDINMRLAKAWTAINRLLVIWKSDLTDKIKRSFFQAAVVSILLYGCTTWTLTKWMEKKLDSNYMRILWAILNKYWRQHPTKQQLYGHIPPIMKTIQVRGTRHVGHCWRS